MALMPINEANTELPAPETIEQLFDALESPLLSYAGRLTNNGEAAEDIVQEAFMKLHRHFSEVREPRRWLYRTVHNIALNQMRKESKVVPLRRDQEGEDPELLESVDPELLPDEQIARLEGIGLVRLSLDALEPRSRQVVRLKFNENLSYKEISERTGLSVGLIGYLLHHALKTVADELARNGMTS
jgi:RNA polymerase sigma-70 factor (ECF subfamily)